MTDHDALWKDTSRFSQSDKERVPNEFMLTVGKFKLIVHRHIYYPKDVWVASCRPYVFEHCELESKDIKEAKCQAADMLYVILRDAIDALARRIAIALMSGRELASQGELNNSLLAVIGSDNYRRCCWKLEELSLLIANVLREALPTSETCEWMQQDDIFGTDWVTECGKEFRIDEGIPTENGMTHCCFCGKKLIDIPFPETEDDES